MTGSIPGIGGRLKERPADFEVVELPLFDSSAEGPHYYLTLTREGMSTREVCQSLATQLRVSKEQIGYAGLKDKQARATQTFSVELPRVGIKQIEQALAGGPLLIEAITRHQHKLRLGRLRGNRFRLRVSGCHEQARERLSAKLAVLERWGFPNFFGEQRFGESEDNVANGLRVLRGQMRPDAWLRGFLISAVQSHIFNLVLAARMRAGHFERLLSGDVARIEPDGAFFSVEDLPTEQARFEAGEISFTGPLPGRQMREPGADALALERKVMREFDSDVGRLLGRRQGPRGMRRAGRVFVSDFKVVAQAGESPGDLRGDLPGELTLEFSLPPGCYATSIMRELMEEGSSG